jgi:hypothetical protein
MKSLFLFLVLSFTANFASAEIFECEVLRARNGALVCGGPMYRIDVDGDNIWVLETSPIRPGVRPHVDRYPAEFVGPIDDGRLYRYRDLEIVLSRYPEGPPGVPSVAIQTVTLRTRVAGVVVEAPCQATNFAPEFVK